MYNSAIIIKIQHDVSMGSTVGREIISLKTDIKFNVFMPLVCLYAQNIPVKL